MTRRDCFCHHSWFAHGDRWGKSGCDVGGCTCPGYIGRPWLCFDCGAWHWSDQDKCLPTEATPDA